MTPQTKTPITIERADAQPALDGVPDLYRHPDAERLRTPFRDAACRRIPLRATEIAALGPVSAEMSAWSYPGDTYS